MDLSHILNDRESGSVALLMRLVETLEDDLHGTGLSMEDFNSRMLEVREKLRHFAAIENFLLELSSYSAKPEVFPEEALRFIAVYKLYWQGSIGAITENFLATCNPEGLTILTHSHSQTIISLLTELKSRQINFRVLQTLSSPGEEGRLSLDRIRQQKIQAELIEDTHLTEALQKSDLVLMGCDALLPGEFLNKVGTFDILQEAKQQNKPTYLISESRKEIDRPEWKDELSDQSLFEWVPLHLINHLVSERS